MITPATKSSRFRQRRELILQPFAPIFRSTSVTILANLRTMAWLGLSDEEIDAMECLKANVGSASTHLTLRSYVSMTGADPSVHVWLKNQYFSDNKDFNIADLLMCANFVREGRKQTAHAADWHMSLSKYNPLLWENMNYFARLLEPEVRRNSSIATSTKMC